LHVYFNKKNFPRGPWSTSAQVLLARARTHVCTLIAGKAGELNVCHCQLPQREASANEEKGSRKGTCCVLSLVDSMHCQSREGLWYLWLTQDFIN
jgi:hypothetical protein